uniref:Rab3 GTPase-activating protein catalytic subunit n=1 Tax=Meloidogyne incognita TaxID=6306 RepID=A0A914LZF3_MELIC
MDEHIDSSSSNILGDGDVFEINDFTVITDFEVFVLSLENVLHELKNEVENQNITLASDVSSCNIQKIAHKEVVYESYKFKVDYFKQLKSLQLEEDIEVIFRTDVDEVSNYLCNNSKAFLDDNGGFRENSVISRQYGVDSDFILLYTNDKKYFTDSVINMVQSAVTVATANIDFDLPILFQFYPGASTGSMQNKDCCTTFEGCILNKCLNRHKTLDGAVEMFKQKIDSPLCVDDEIKIALQYDFKKDLSNDVDNFHKGLSIDAGTNCPHKFTLQRIDPSLIKGFCLSAVFIQNSFNVDSTDEFEIENAKFWKISFDFDDEFSYELSYTLTRLLEHKEEEYSTQTVKSLIPQSNTETKSMAASALGPLLDKPAVNFELVPKLDIFSDDDFSHEGLSDCLKFIVEEGNAFEFGGNDSNRDQLLRKLSLAKSAPQNSLTRRLSTCLLTRVDKNLVGFCRLWIKFVDILRHYWEYNMDLPGFEQDEKPDLSHCLLHQKLQMIQHCIFVKRSRHSDFEFKLASGQSNEDDDEFFDAPDDFSTETPISKSDIPRGRSALLEPPQFLKNNPKERIYIPLTLNKGPMTEDQLNKHESFLLELEDSDLRNRAQSDLLFSDMQAFKAANPGAVLEDFLCWHSPRDFVDGELSERMKLPGNLWQENWRMVRPIPASKQNRLFNETKEVEQILQHFSTIKLKDLIDLLLPVVIVQTIEVLIRESSECTYSIKERLESVLSEFLYASKSDNYDMDVFYDLTSSLRSIEEFLLKYSSIVNLLVEQAITTNISMELNSCVSSLVNNLCRPIQKTCKDELSLKNELNNVLIPDLSECRVLEVLKSFFGNDVWKEPKRKQIILRTMVPRPGSGSRPMPQRMYISHQDDEFILRGSFTSDLTYA